MYCTTKEEYLSIEKMKKMKNVEKIKMKIYKNSIWAIKTMFQFKFYKLKIICVWVKLNENKSLNKQI